MQIIFLVLVIVSALLIIGGVVVLSLGRKDRRRRTAMHHQSHAVTTDPAGHTISAILADGNARQPEPAEPAAETRIPVEAIETAIGMGPAILSAAGIQSEEERQARQDQALLFLQGTEALCTLQYAFNKWDSAKSQEKRQTLSEEIKACLATIDTENIRSACKATFDAMYPAFSEQLLRLSPDLNEAELRLCVFLALGQSTKDMAALTRRSVRTIETTTYHLRKKLAIPTEEKTSDFLKKFLY